MKQMSVIDAYDDDTTSEIRSEMQDLWATKQFGNDVYYYHWRDDDEKYGTPEPFEELYPLLHKHIMDSGVTECFITYSW